MDAEHKLSANEFRESKEKIILFSSLLIVALLLLLVMGINPIIPIVIFLYAAGWIKIKQKQLLGNTVPVSESSFTDIHNASNIVADRLSMNRPDIFVQQDPVINAYATGIFGKKSVVLHSALVEAMNKDELLSILGHEFSHIKCGHTIWGTITNTQAMIQIPFISNFLGFLFLYWSRIAEYTADRGGLIACRNLKATSTAFIKLAVGKELASKVNVEDFLEQVKKERLATQMAGFLLTHPYLADRIRCISAFYDSDKYRKICNNQFEHEDTKVNDILKGIDTILKKKNFGDLIKKNVKTKNLEKITCEIKKIFDDFSSPKIMSPVSNPISDERAPIPKKKKRIIKPTKKKDNTFSSASNVNEKKVSDLQLISAVIDERLIEVDRLIECGIDPNIKDMEGDTPLHLAVRLKNIEIVKYLLRVGASISQKNNEGETPFSIAEKNESKALIELFQNF